MRAEVQNILEGIDQRKLADQTNFAGFDGAAASVDLDGLTDPPGQRPTANPNQVGVEAP